jgi:dCTP deaminase
MLPYQTIKKLCEQESIIDPYDISYVQPASYDVHLANKICRQTADGLEYSDISNKCKLKPGDFILASTVEKVRIPSYLCCRFEGKSSLGRIGLMTHVTAGFIDPGFEGNITLEIKNLSNVNIYLHAGMAIGQLSFERLEAPSEIVYGDPKLHSHYNHQTGPTPAWSQESLDHFIKE